MWPLLIFSALAYAVYEAARKAGTDPGVSRPPPSQAALNASARAAQEPPVKAPAGLDPLAVSYLTQAGLALRDMLTWLQWRAAAASSPAQLLWDGQVPDNYDRWYDAWRMISELVMEEGAAPSFPLDDKSKTILGAIADHRKLAAMAADVPHPRFDVTHWGPTPETFNE